MKKRKNFMMLFAVIFGLSLLSASEAMARNVHVSVSGGAYYYGAGISVYATKNHTYIHASYYPSWGYYSRPFRPMYIANPNTSQYQNLVLQAEFKKSQWLAMQQQVIAPPPAPPVYEKELTAPQIELGNPKN